MMKAIPSPRRISIAPMMEYTDKHYRYLMRLLSQSAYLYTEMVTSQQMIHAPTHRKLQFDPIEHPVAIQLGGSDPQELAGCAVMSEDFGYDEINLNVGCPSDRVQSGRMGACLMAEPELVAECVAAMLAAVKIPVTVKTRIGIDNDDSEESLQQFIDCVAKSGCKTFIIHARKAWLKGLSPKENRTVPPLNYDRVYRLKQEFQHLEIIINGGITDLSESLKHLQHMDGVMIGREAYRNPYFIADLEKILMPQVITLSRKELLLGYLHYMEKEFAEGTHLTALLKPVLGVFQGMPGARHWRRFLTENCHEKMASPKIIVSALESFA